MLVRALPHDAPLWVVLEAAEKAAQKAKPDEIRERQAAWERRNAERLAKEAAEHER